MSATLTESLDVLLGSGTSSRTIQHLIGPAALLDLKKLTTNLSPILRGGFECRLAANSPQVDFQQCVIADEQDLSLLHKQIADLIEKKCVSGSSGKWRKLQYILTYWKKNLSLNNQDILEIWLEFDIDNTSAFLPLPAIFFGLAQEVVPATSTYCIAEKVLTLLLGKAGWFEWQKNLYRCFSACPDGVFISHIGVMLSRQERALRVNIKRLEANSLIPYLQKIGWEGETKKLELLIKQLFSLVERITVCLDVGEKIYPQIGLECIFLKQPENEPRWITFLNYLVEQGLCDQQKKEGLLNWPAQINPLNSSVVWPADLIAASLLQPKNCFTVFERRLSHIKIVYKPPKIIEAKAYLWFQHQWLSLERKNADGHQ